MSTDALSRHEPIGFVANAKRFIDEAKHPTDGRKNNLLQRVGVALLTPLDKILKREKSDCLIKTALAVVSVVLLPFALIGALCYKLGSLCLSKAEKKPDTNARSLLKDFTDSIQNLEVTIANCKEELSTSQQELLVDFCNKAKDFANSLKTGKTGDEAHKDAHAEVEESQEAFNSVFDQLCKKLFSDQPHQEQFPEPIRGLAESVCTLINRPRFEKIGSDLKKWYALDSLTAASQ